MTKRTAREAYLDTVESTFTDAFGAAHDDDIPAEVWDTLERIDPFGLDDDSLASAAGCGPGTKPSPALHWERDRSLTDAEMGFGRGRPEGLYGLRGYRPDGAK
jgi:hypothetical protein